MTNINSWYGRLTAQSATPKWLGKTFYVSSSSGTTADILLNVFGVDDDGVNRVYSTITLALAACVTGRWDNVVIASDYTTAPTDTELGSAGTKWVKISFANYGDADEQIAMTSNKALPASTAGSIFTVTGVVELLSIIWVVTTVIQAQANATKIQAISNAATTDLCATLDINGNAAQSRYSITGTFANAMINTAKWVPVARQATSVILQEWTIALNCAATNTWNVRWFVRYKPLQEGARIVWA